MLWPSCQSLRSCVLHHPPFVTFFICVVTLGVTYLALGVYIKTQPVSDVDFTQDWGGVLQAFTVGKVCIQGNGSRHITTVDETRTVNPENSANVSVLVTFTVSPWQLALNHSNLQIIATGAQLGMTGTDADTPLTITLTSYWGYIQCNGSEVECAVKYCVSLTGPRELLPQTSWSPQCPVNGSAVPVVPELYVLETEASSSAKCLVYHGDLTQNIIPEEDAALCAQRLREVALVILFLGLLLTVMFVFCTPPFKEKKTGGPL
ncbi:unnamed protein product [Staurois parvus]|uniref:TMEM248/TMEM219 domain-containing protein n=1 Tax=Staurois parvus TaxID=386267 RepID=A0ABN9CVB1_9NEOB|nr:unnamed protein product [Staurois parvus]